MDINELTAAEAIEVIQTANEPTLKEWAEQEKAGKNRKTVLSALDAALAAQAPEAEQAPAEEQPKAEPNPAKKAPSKQLKKIPRKLHKFL